MNLNFDLIQEQSKWYTFKQFQYQINNLNLSLKYQIRGQRALDKLNGWEDSKTYWQINQICLLS